MEAAAQGDIAQRLEEGAAEEVIFLQMVAEDQAQLGHASPVSPAPGPPPRTAGGGGVPPQWLPFVLSWPGALPWQSLVLALPPPSAPPRSDPPPVARAPPSVEEQAEDETLEAQLAQWQAGYRRESERLTAAAEALSAAHAGDTAAHHSQGSEAVARHRDHQAAKKAIEEARLAALRSLTARQEGAKRALVLARAERAARLLLAQRAGAAIAAYQAAPEPAPPALKRSRWSQGKAPAAPPPGEGGAVEALTVSFFALAFDGGVR